MRMNCICSRTLAVLVGVFALALATPAWATIGNGVLTVDNGGDCGGNDACGTKPQPQKWDVTPGSPIHIHIQAMGGSCTTGPFVGKQCTATSDCTSAGSCNKGTHQCKGNPSMSCSFDDDCDILGTCTPGTLECSGSTTVWVKGKHGSCQSGQVGTQGDCASGETCVDEGGIFTCSFADPIAATVSGDGKSIDVCYTTAADSCFTAAVAYCTIGNEAADNMPSGSGSRAASGLRFVNTCGVLGTCSISGDPCFDGGGCKMGGGVCVGAFKPDAIQDCEREIPTCSNEVGSFCCGLTQGAYGAPNSIATAQCSSGSPATCPSSPVTAGAGCGFIPAACSQGCDIFAGDTGCPSGVGNATTAGIHCTRAVTIDNLLTLEAYMPSISTAGCFKTSGPSAVSGDTHFGTAGSIPDENPQQTNSRGEGGGVLAGQAMATRLNDFLSNCATPFGGSSTFTAPGFGGFQIPSDGSLVCTKTSGGDKTLGTGDDVCRAFAYPSCTWGQTIGSVLNAANTFLATCSDSILGCSAVDLNVALTNANEEFDNCGVVIDCGSQTTAGTFTCP